MATTTTRKRVGDYNPDIETGETLDKIEGQEVQIASVSFDRRTGKKGRYTLAIITLDGGAIYHTGGSVVAERLAALFGYSLERLNEELDAGAPTPTAPSDVFPVDATFHMEASASNPGQRYWTVD